VLGGGVTGLTAALLLARDGNDVVVVERDRFESGDAEASVAWARRGIPHYLLPHAFIPRGRTELRRHLPDVYNALLAAGADEIDAVRVAPGGERRPGDDELRYVGVRRPVIEWALRRAVRAEPGVTVRDGVRVEGLRVEHGQVTAARLDGADLESDVVVDALGRRTPTDRWLAEAGISRPPVEQTDCEVVYYARYYRVRSGHVLPDGPWLFGPRGDLGYLGFATFPGDNGTFAALLAVPSGVPEWRAFKDAAVFEAAVAAIPALVRWVEPGAVEPITDVLPMAGLRNSLRSTDGLAATGLVPAGDALGHTDPVLAHGLAFGLIHAAALAAALREHWNLGDAAQAYTSTVMPALRERYELAGALDAQRHRGWCGATLDFAGPDGDYALFSMAAAAQVAMRDPDVFRVFVRRLSLLDGLDVLDDDAVLRARIHDEYRRIAAVPRRPSGPDRDAMVTLTKEAVRAIAGPRTAG